MTPLQLAFSSCPNDTFAFHALVHGLVDGPAVEPVLLDIEELNRAARVGRYPITKLSAGLLGAVTERYQLLRAGAALGHGSGPLVVASEFMTLAQAAAGRIAIPGRDTTAFRLLTLAAGAVPNAVPIRYDRIVDAVASGEVTSGLIIHESRFTYADHGLAKVADLGEWWEAETGLAVPLGVIAARRDLAATQIASVENAIRASVEYAFAHPKASRDYVRANSQELSEEVCDQHISLYVNGFSIDLGEAGMAAIARLGEDTHP